MLKKLLLPLLGSVAALYPATSKAQTRAHNLPGYVVTVRGDTLRGVLDVPQFPTEYGIKFYPTLQAPAQQFDMRDVRAFGLQDGRRFLKRNLAAGQNLQTGVVDSATVILQHLIGGAANFYRYDLDAARHRQHDYSQAETVQLFVSLAGGNLISMKRVTYQTVLAAVFKDCPAVVNALPRTGYAEDKLGDLVLRYNTDCHATVPAHDNRLPRVRNPVRVLVSLRGGVQQSQLYYPNFTFLQREGMKMASLPVYGLEVRFANKGAWSASIGVQVAKLRGETSFVTPAQLGTDNAGQPLTLPFSVQAQHVQFPLFVRYTYGHARLRPYLAAGFMLGTYYNTKTTLSSTALTYSTVGTTTTYHDNVVINTAPDRPTNPPTVSGTIRLGLQVKVATHFSPLLEIQYSSGSDGEDHPGTLQNYGQLENLGHLHYRALSFVAGVEF